MGQKAANRLGLYDMAGNVGEWTEDVYASGAYLMHEQHNPLFGERGKRRCTRGGSWADGPSQLRCSARRGVQSRSRSETIGFRLVRIPR